VDTGSVLRIIPPQHEDWNTKEGWAGFYFDGSVIISAHKDAMN